MPSPHLPELAIVYIRWTFLRTILHRGWWLVTSLYLVVEANLSPLELVFLGTAQGVVVIAFEVPTGAMADTFSRKWSLVVAHLLMGTAMLSTGLVTDFTWLLLTQMLWGLSWTFLSGADVAWLADEIDQPSETGTILTRAARWGQIGAAFGLCFFGVLAWLTTLSTAMISAGIMMLLLGIYVITRFSETRFRPLTGRRLTSFLNTLRDGTRQVRQDKTIVLILGVTFLINGADEVFSRLFAKRLLVLDLPQIPDPIAWLTLLGLTTLALGAVALRIVENRLNAEPALRRWYLIACILGAFGLVLFALAPDYLIAMAGVIVVHGIAWNIVRIVGIIWTNARSQSETRATLQSFLSQAENLGEISIGFGLGVVAELAGIPIAIIGATLFVAIAILLITRVRSKTSAGQTPDTQP